LRSSLGVTIYEGKSAGTGAGAGAGGAADCENADPTDMNMTLTVRQSVSIIKRFIFGLLSRALLINIHPHEKILKLKN